VRFLRSVLGSEIKLLAGTLIAAFAGTPCKPRLTKPPSGKGFTKLA